MENNVFEQMAKRYDTEERIELAKVIVNEVRQELRNSQSKSLIDYGSGTGLISLELSDLVHSICWSIRQNKCWRWRKLKFLAKESPTQKCFIQILPKKLLN